MTARKKADPKKHPMPELDGVTIHVSLRVIEIEDHVDLAHLMVFINLLIEWSGDVVWKVSPGFSGGIQTGHAAPWPDGTDGYGGQAEGRLLRLHLHRCDFLLPSYRLLFTEWGFGMAGGVMFQPRPASGKWNTTGTTMEQREIKFEAWDGHGSMFVQVIDRVTDHGIVFVLREDIDKDPHEQTWYPFSYVMADNSWVKRQFTGLRDKNGREIYQGDILRGEYEASHSGVYQNTVEWVQEDAAFSLANSPLWAWDWLEVIGNVFENPELMNQ